MFCSRYLWLAYEAPHQANRDLLVAIVAIGLGLILSYSILTRHPKLLQLATYRTLERAFGHQIATLIIYGLSGLCLLMGGHLINQFVSHRASGYEMKNRSISSLDVSRSTVD